MRQKSSLSKTTQSVSKAVTGYRIQAFPLLTRSFSQLWTVLIVTPLFLAGTWKTLTDMAPGWRAWHFMAI